MSAETAASRDDEFSQRMRREGDLGLKLCNYVWDHYGVLRLGAEEFESVSCDEVPGYEDAEYAVLLRRKSDGLVFEAEIDVTIKPVLTPAQQAAQLAVLRGQLTRPGVPS